MVHHIPLSKYNEIIQSVSATHEKNQTQETHKEETVTNKTNGKHLSDDSNTVVKAIKNQQSSLRTVVS